MQVILDVIEKKLGIVLDQSRYKLREKQNEEILEWDTVVRTVRTNELFLYPRYESSKTVYCKYTSQYCWCDLDLSLGVSLWYESG